MSWYESKVPRIKAAEEEVLEAHNETCRDISGLCPNPRAFLAPETTWLAWAGRPQTSPLRMSFPFHKAAARQCPGKESF